MMVLSSVISIAWMDYKGDSFPVPDSPQGFGSIPIKVRGRKEYTCGKRDRDFSDRSISC
jgi:hypothetical protein